MSVTVQLQPASTALPIKDLSFLNLEAKNVTLPDMVQYKSPPVTSASFSIVCTFSPES